MRPETVVTEQKREGKTQDWKPSQVEFVDEETPKEGRGRRESVEEDS